MRTRRWSIALATLGCFVAACQSGEAEPEPSTDAGPTESNRLTIDDVTLATTDTTPGGSVFVDVVLQGAEPNPSLSVTLLAPTGTARSVSVDFAFETDGAMHVGRGRMPLPESTGGGRHRVTQVLVTTASGFVGDTWEGELEFTVLADASAVPLGQVIEMSGSPLTIEDGGEVRLDFVVESMAPVSAIELFMRNPWFARQGHLNATASEVFSVETNEVAPGIHHVHVEVHIPPEVPSGNYAFFGPKVHDGFGRVGPIASHTVDVDVDNPNQVPQPKILDARKDETAWNDGVARIELEVETETVSPWPCLKYGRIGLQPLMVDACPNELDWQSVGLHRFVGSFQPDLSPHPAFDPSVFYFGLFTIGDDFKMLSEPWEGTVTFEFPAEEP